MHILSRDGNVLGSCAELRGLRVCKGEGGSTVERRLQQTGCDVSCCANIAAYTLGNRPATDTSESKHRLTISLRWDDADFNHYRALRSQRRCSYIPATWVHRNPLYGDHRILGCSCTQQYARILNT
jgi:hypothetical protein